MGFEIEKSAQGILSNVFGEGAVSDLELTDDEVQAVGLSVDFVQGFSTKNVINARQAAGLLEAAGPRRPQAPAGERSQLMSDEEVRTFAGLLRAVENGQQLPEAQKRWAKGKVESYVITTTLGVAVKDYVRLGMVKPEAAEAMLRKLAAADPGIVKAGVAQINAQLDSEKAPGAFSLKEKAAFRSEVMFGPQRHWQGALSLSNPAPTPDGLGFVVSAHAMTGKHKVLCLNSDGSTRWTYPASPSEFLSEPLSAPAVKGDTTAVSTREGRVIVLDTKTGGVRAERQLTDPDGVRQLEGQGPFGEPSAIDGRTIAIPSTSGKVFLLADDGSVSTVQVAQRDQSNKHVYFWGTIRARNDGMLAVAVGDGATLFTRDGATVKHYRGIRDIALSVSADGDAFVLARDWPQPGSITVVPKDGPEYSHTVADKNTQVWTANLNAAGDVVFTAKVGPSDRHTDVIGIIPKGSQEHKIVSVPRGDILSSNFSAPTFDKQGRIFVSNLDSRLFGFAPDGSLQSVTELGGESRSTPLVLANGSVVAFANGTLYRGNGSIRFFDVAKTR